MLNYKISRDCKNFCLRKFKLELHVPHGICIGEIILIALSYVTGPKRTSLIYKNTSIYIMVYYLIFPIL